MYRRSNGGGGGQQHQPQPEPQQKSGGDRQPPVQEFRAGKLKIAAWENAGDKGPWLSFTFTRSYLQGAEWKTASSLGVADLLPLAGLLLKAWLWSSSGGSQNNGNDGSDVPF